jgi:Domain of unknown function (DUF6794)
MANRFRETIPAGDLPRNVDEAVERLISELPLKDRAKIAKMDKSETTVLHMTLGPHIREKYGLWTGNQALMESCRVLSGQDKCHINTASSMIIDAMWAQLRRTHPLRMVK